MRLFYALTLPSEAILHAQALMHDVEGARWQSSSQLHLTLRFVGEVSPLLVDELLSVLPAGRAELPSFTLSGAGYFETQGRPNALWIGVRPREPLVRLHQKFDRACQSAGLEPERRSYTPHITVARLPRSAGPIAPWIDRHLGFSMAPVYFQRCGLFESIATKNGSHYEEIASVPLT